jgi:hypothetical protein
VSPALGCVGLGLLLPLLLGSLVVAPALLKIDDIPAFGVHYHAEFVEPGHARLTGYYRGSTGADVWAAQFGPFWCCFAVPRR